MKALRGQPSVWRKVVAAWTLAFVFAAPQLFIFVETEEGQRADGRTVHACSSRGYTAEWQRKVYFSFMTTYILVVPTAVMSFCYLNIIRAVWMRPGGAAADIDRPRIHFVTSRRTRELSCVGVGSCRVLVTTNDGGGGGGGGGGGARRYSTMAVSTATRPIGYRGPLTRKASTSSATSKRNVIKMTLSVIIGFVVCWTPYFTVR